MEQRQGKKLYNFYLETPGGQHYNLCLTAIDFINIA
jgi:hypothetical protein